MDMDEQENRAVTGFFDEEPKDVVSTDVGKLLYTISDRSQGCGKKYWLQLQFYEHLLVVRSSERHACECLSETYTAEAFPRFKIMNVGFANGSRSRWRWSVLILVVAVVVILPLASLANSSALTWTLLALALVCAIIPLFLFSHHRYVTFHLRSDGGIFRTGSTASYCFRKEKPDEDFIMDYVFGSLRQGHSATHKVSHLNWTALAEPMKVQLQGALDEGTDAERSSEP